MGEVDYVIIDSISSFENLGQGWDLTPERTPNLVNEVFHQLCGGRGLLFKDYEVASKWAIEGLEAWGQEVRRQYPDNVNRAYHGFVLYPPILPTESPSGLVTARVQIRATVDYLVYGKLTVFAGANCHITKRGFLIIDNLEENADNPFNLTREDSDALAGRPWCKCCGAPSDYCRDHDCCPECEAGFKKLEDR